jgi:hypothetical protein
MTMTCVSRTRRRTRKKQQDYCITERKETERMSTHEEKSHACPE